MFAIITFNRCSIEIHDIPDCRQKLHNVFFDSINFPTVDIFCISFHEINFFLLFFRFFCVIEKVFSFLSKDEVEKLKQEEERKIATLRSDKNKSLLFDDKHDNDEEEDDDTEDNIDDEDEYDNVKTVDIHHHHQLHYANNGNDKRDATLRECSDDYDDDDDEDENDDDNEDIR